MHLVNNLALIYQILPNFNFSSMKNNNQKTLLFDDKILDLYIRARSSLHDDRIEDPSSELGDDDQWLIKLFNSYIARLTGAQFLDFLEKIITLTKNKYSYLKDNGFIIFKIVEEVVSSRPTSKNVQMYHGQDKVVLEFSDEEESRLIQVILNLKNGLSDAHKYETYRLIKELTGKWLGKEDKYAP